MRGRWRRPVNYATAIDGWCGSVVGGCLKRWFDATAALAALLLLMPLFCLIALAIKLWNGGPVFYRHSRVGLEGKRLIASSFAAWSTMVQSRLASHSLVSDSKLSAFQFSFSARRDLISLSSMPSFGWYCGEVRAQDVGAGEQGLAHLARQAFGIVQGNQTPHWCRGTPLKKRLALLPGQ